MSYRVSVAIATYNGERYIIEQLTSIMEQTRRVDEVVICDDRSSDNTVKVVEGFIKDHQLDSWKIIVNQSNLGFSHNFWKAMTSCSGDIIFLSDQDDAWYPNKVSEVINVFQDESINMVSCSYDACDSVGKVGNTSVKWQRVKNDGSIEEITFKEPSTDTRIRGCSMAFRRSILAHEPYIANNLGHDWIVTCLATLKGRAVFFNRVLFKYRVHDSNASSARQTNVKQSVSQITSKRAKSLEGEVKAFSHLAKHDLVTPQYKKALRKRASFSSKRADLYTRFSLIKLLRLLPYLPKYVQLSRHGILGGVVIYLEDARYSIEDRLKASR